MFRSFPFSFSSSVAGWCTSARRPRRRP
jgi:hypothetical protein